MRILFDGFWWAEGPRSNAMVQREIVRAWSELFPQDDLCVATRKNVENLPAGVQQLRTYLPLQLLVNFFELPALAARWQADSVLAHNFATPTSRIKSSVFIHDLIFMDHPEWFTYSENAYFMLMTFTSRFATMILTSSHSEANRIARILNREVKPTLLGISPDLIETTPKRPNFSSGIEPKLFSLVVGRINARKNLRRTIIAALESGTVTPSQPLVVVGEEAGKVDRLTSSIRDAIKSRSIIILDSVSVGELAWLYVNARKFLLFSLDEGFGLPGIEARYFKTPTVASDISVFREILGEGAVYADPTDITSMAKAIALDRSAPGDLESKFTWPEVVREISASIQQMSQGAV